MVSLIIMDKDSPSKTAISDHNRYRQCAVGPHNSSKAKKAVQELHKCLGISCPEEMVLKSYSCAWQKDILVHGKIHLTENWICFYSNILGWETKTRISLTAVTSITKQRTAVFFPAILIETADKKYGFGSFLHRDRAYQLLHAIWNNFCLHRPFTGVALRQHLNNKGHAGHSTRSVMSSLCMEECSDLDTASILPCSPTDSSTPSPQPPLRPSPSSLHSNSHSDTQTSSSGNTSVDVSSASLIEDCSITGEADLCNGGDGVDRIGVRCRVYATSSSNEEEEEEATFRRDMSSCGDDQIWETSDGPRHSLSAPNISSQKHLNEMEALTRSNLQITCHNNTALKLYSRHDYHHHHHRFNPFNWRAVWVWTLDATWLQSVIHLCTSTHLINSLIILFILVLLLSMVSMFCQLCQLEPTLQPYMVWQPWCACMIPLRGLPPN